MFLINELSIHAQFGNIGEFSEALRRMLQMRDIATRFGREIHCKFDIEAREPIEGIVMKRAVSNISDKGLKVEIAKWFSKIGRFWDERERNDRSIDLWLHVDDDVSLTGIGEAALRVYCSEQCDLMSFIPSNWDISPVEVKLVDSEGEVQSEVQLVNWRNSEGLSGYLMDAMPQVKSWEQLQDRCKAHHKAISMNRRSFEGLRNVPFAPGAASRIFDILTNLNNLASIMEEKDSRPEDVQNGFEEYLRKDNRFSDSSRTEKEQFREELTFQHPDGEGYLFCTWHGKVSPRNLRIHFALPKKEGESITVAYIGPKVTKK